MMDTESKLIQLESLLLYFCAQRIVLKPQYYVSQFLFSYAELKFCNHTYQVQFCFDIS
jgi:hypothetical protein